MRFYFNWVQNNTIFDPTQIDFNLNQESIFNLEILEREGQFPLAIILIQNPYRGLLNRHYYTNAFISVEKDQKFTLLFAGQIIGVPNKIDGEMMEITLMAKPADSAAQIKQLQEKLKQAPYWDSLFIPQSNQDDLSEVLDGRCELPYWSRLNEPLRLSDIFWGSQRYILGNRFFRDNFKFQNMGNPLTSVHVVLKMEWIQKYRGRTDISYFLRSHFSQGLISTFTGKNLESKWWRKGETIGHSGYWIDYSQLVEVPALPTGILGLYPAASSNITLSPHDPLNNTGKPQQVKLKRSWYRSKIILGWSYRQKRVETVTFNLKNQLQISQNNALQTRTLRINLQPFVSETAVKRKWQAGILYQPKNSVIIDGTVYQATQAHLSSDDIALDWHLWQEIVDHEPTRQAAQQCSFFTTDRGHQAIDHAIDVAQVHLADSARAVKLVFQAPFDAVMHLTCDHSVLITDDRLPDGQAWGKIKALRLVVEGHSGRLWGELTLVSGIGEGPIDAAPANLGAPSFQNVLYCYEDYCEEPLGIDQAQGMPTATSIHYNRHQLTGPSQGILYPDQLTAYDIVSAVKILNDPEHQQQALIQNQYPVRHNLAAVLSENCTEIVLRLKDLQSLPKLEHHIELSLSNDWTAPQQINLKATKNIG